MKLVSIYLANLMSHHSHSSKIFGFYSHSVPFLSLLKFRFYPSSKVQLKFHFHDTTSPDDTCLFLTLGALGGCLFCGMLGFSVVLQ